MAACVHFATSCTRSQQLGGCRAGEGDRIVAELVDDWRPLAPEPASIGCGDLGESGVVSGPLENVLGQSLELFPPARIVRRYVGWADDEDVYVAGGVAVASGRRAEERDVRWGKLPFGDLRSQATLELGADVGEQLDRGRSEMLSIERVQVGAPGLLRAHEALFAQSPQCPVDRRLRSGTDEAGDLSAREWTSRATEDAQHLHVDRRADERPGAGEIHCDKDSTHSIRCTLM